MASSAQIPTFSIVPCNAIVMPVTAPAVADTVDPADRVAAGDRDLLEYIFDPAPTGGPQSKALCELQQITDEELGPAGPVITADLLAQLKTLEVQGIAEAEARRFLASINHFTRAIALCPHYASAFNNRAQSKLLARDEDGAIEDLNTAIALAHRDRITLRQAHTQRAIIYRQRGMIDEARADFAMAGRLGSAMARTEAVKLNPYAAMCSQMLAQAMHALVTPQIDIEHHPERQ